VFIGAFKSAAAAVACAYSGFFDEQIKELKSNTEEIDPDEYDMNCKCPKCGFEFDAKT